MTVQDLYPLSLRLLARKVLMVGGGAVATRRVQGLLDAGAQVTVVSPAISPELERLASAGLLKWEQRPYRRSDLEDTWLVHTASDDPVVEQQVAADAEAQRLWCVSASDQELASAWTPAVARTAGITLAVNADGDPRRAVAVKNRLMSVVELDESSSQAWPQRQKRHSEEGQSTVGSVALIGGGPGADGLITVTGRKLLAQAEVVLVDYLAPQGLLETLDPQTEIINVGKRPGKHSVSQERINQLLVTYAKEGKRVARLKGGDPYVLGRGGEEAEYCRTQGIPVQIVPGVTSATAVPAAVGIPVTHRGVARSFSVISAHEDLVDVPSGSGHTVVLLMGIRTLQESARVLAARGRGAECPVAIIESGFAPEQRLTIGTLGDIAKRAEARGVAAPAVVVVGDVVRLSPLAPQEMKQRLLQEQRLV